MPQIFNLRKLAIALAMFALVGIASATAKADGVIFDSSPGNFANDENVLLDTAQTGNPIFGLTNQTQLNVRFTGAETLTALANGQARVEALDGAYAYLKIDIPGGSYTSLIININALEDGDVHFVVTTTTGPYTFDSTLAAGGQNFSRFLADGATRILSVEFWTSTGVSLTIEDAVDTRQVRIGGAQLDAVPEPASMLLLGTGLFGVAGAARRRFKK
ncbi:MAG: PEP-CTERM sorting domain-containing protein [Pyrinomonadaceae bacterium]